MPPEQEKARKSRVELILEQLDALPTLPSVGHEVGDWHRTHEDVTKNGRKFRCVFSQRICYFARLPIAFILPRAAGVTIVELATATDRKRQAAKVTKALAAGYPVAECALRHETPEQLLIATILSAQCTDERVNLVTAVLFATGTYLLLQRRLSRIIVGIGLVGHGANILLVTSGGGRGLPPIIDSGDPTDFSDPLPQALALTSIVITFGVSAYLLAMAYRSWTLTRADEVEDDVEDRRIAAMAAARSAEEAEREFREEGEEAP